MFYAIYIFIASPYIVSKTTTYATIVIKGFNNNVVDSRLSTDSVKLYSSLCLNFIIQKGLL